MTGKIIFIFVSLTAISTSSAYQYRTDVDYIGLNSVYDYNDVERQDFPPGKEPWTRSDAYSITLVVIISLIVLQLIDDSILPPIVNPISKPLAFLARTITTPLVVQNRISRSIEADELDFNIKKDNSIDNEELLDHFMQHKDVPKEQHLLHRQKRQDFPPGKEPWSRADSYGIGMNILVMMLLLQIVDGTVLSAILWPISKPIGLIVTSILLPLNNAVDQLITILENKNKRSIDDNNDYYSYNFLTELTDKIVPVIEADDCLTRITCEALSYTGGRDTFVQMLTPFIKPHFSTNKLKEDSSTCQLFTCGYLDNSIWDGNTEIIYE